MVNRQYKKKSGTPVWLREAIPMTEELLRELRKIVPEEQRILDGKTEIERELYVGSENNTFY